MTGPIIVTACTGTVALISLGLVIWQWLEARRFPLHQRLSPLHPPPGVTLLKPLKGLTPQTVDCLRSWFQQDFKGPVQFLFGVASKHDPVCQVVRALAAEHPHLDVHLILAAERPGTNGKISTLIQLEPHITHDLILMSDADVWAPHDFLTQIVAFRHQEAAALANSFYAFRPTPTPHLMAQLEAVTVNADFWPQVLQASRLAPLDFALGAAMLTHRDWLRNVGGFEPLANCLADDFHLGQRIARAGGRIALSPVVVECRGQQQSWKEVWQHQLRWARTIRVCRPLPYFASILNNATGWALVFLFLGSALPLMTRLIAAGIICAVRAFTARNTQARLVHLPNRLDLWMPLAKDLIQPALWAMAFLGNTVVWHGERFQVRRDGKLERGDCGAV